MLNIAAWYLLTITADIDIYSSRGASMKIAVIGAGNWGTTLAHLFGREHDVMLCTRTSDHADSINEKRENIKYLKGIGLAGRVRAARYLSEPFDPDDIIVVAVPSHQVRQVARDLSGKLLAQPVICASKGFEHATMKTMSEVLHDELPTVPLIVLTGPNIAREIAEGKPTKAILASKDFAAVSRVVKTFKNELLAFEICNDVKGVELCASLKGIIAIGVGIADGLGLGKNFMGVLMTYGLREFARISEFLGVSPKTIYGIAGLGDMIATCLSPESRNRRFGFMLGQGIEPECALRNVGMVVEGVQMAKTIVDLENLNIPIPLFATIAKIIFEPNGHLPNKFIQCLQQYQTT
jgi:glycerol-3-phosphate dehydrogenase (NAD(P)+)